MAEFTWEAFLREWSAELLASPQIARSLLPEVRASGWLGFPGASEDQIARAEARLGTMLPPSYRSFLKTSNGWWNTGLLVTHLWSTEEIDWFRVRNQEWIDDWVHGAEYYNAKYPTSQLPEAQDERYHLASALEVSDVGDGAVYLLNPNVRDGNGEWEAWFFSNWNPGAVRHRSFAEMMQAERARFRYVHERTGS